MTAVLQIDQSLLFTHTSANPPICKYDVMKRGRMSYIWLSITSYYMLIWRILKYSVCNSALLYWLILIIQQETLLVTFELQPSLPLFYSAGMEPINNDSRISLYPSFSLTTIRPVIEEALGILVHNHILKQYVSSCLWKWLWSTVKCFQASELHLFHPLPPSHLPQC